MSEQDNLFGIDFRTEKEKNDDDFSDFYKNFLKDHKIFDLYPELSAQGKMGQFLKTFKSLYISHVLNGKWDDELFTLSTLKVLEHRETLSSLTLGRHALRLQDNRGNNSEQ